MPLSPSKKQKAERRGRWGEFAAAIFLLARCYRIRDRRVKTPVGEIDLVVERGRAVVFVEVKTRMHRAGEAEALDAVNRRRITRAAQYYIARYPQLAVRDLRFDVIFLAPFSWPRHVMGAFEASE